MDTASFHTAKPLHREAFTHSKLLHRVREAFIHRKFLHRASLYTEKHLHREAFTHSKLLHTEALHKASFYTEKFLHREALSQRSIYTEKHLHREDFTHRKLSKWGNPLTNHYRSLDAGTPIRFTMSSCKRQKNYARSRGSKQPWRSHYNAICTDWVAKHNRSTRNGVRNCSSKTGWISTPKQKKNTILKHFLKGNLKGKSPAPKFKKKHADK